MFVFYDWPFPRVYFANNAANIIFFLILGSVFSVFHGDFIVGYGARNETEVRVRHFTETRCSANY